MKQECNQVRSIFSFGALLAWVLSARFLYPLPIDIDSGFSLWGIYFLMIAIGLYAAWRLTRSFSVTAFILLTISAAMYLSLRTLHYDSIVYVSLWHSLFSMPSSSDPYLILGGDLLHVAQTIIFSFIVPLMLIATWMGILYLRLSQKK
jgi:hypothetical protein